METEEVHCLVGRIAAVAADCPDLGVLTAAVGEVRRLRSWVDGREVALARQIATLSSFPEKSLADAGRSSLRRGAGVVERAGTAELMPSFDEAMNAGRVGGEHLDVLTRALRPLTPAARELLAGDAPRLVLLAEQSTPEEFAKTVRTETHKLATECDGLEALERQRRAIRMNSWVDKITGMGRWSVTLDPATWAALETRLDAQVEAMFHDTHPDSCPTDPFDKQAFLRAHALLALLNGHGARVGRPEIIIVEDHTNPGPDGQPDLDWGTDIDLPHEYLDTLRPRADTYTVIVADGVVVDAPGHLDLGRTTRVANRAQRRALRGLYSTCAIPGCCVRYTRTKLHHITWWRHGGLTNLQNLIPLCEIHHQKIHHHGWTITLGPHRELTIILPDGQIMSTGPPKRGAA